MTVPSQDEVTCPLCQGYGCSVCDGTGRVKQQVATQYIESGEKYLHTHAKDRWVDLRNLLLSIIVALITFIVTGYLLTGIDRQWFVAIIFAFIVFKILNSQIFSRFLQKFVSSIRRFLS